MPARLRLPALWQSFLLCGALAALAYACCPGLEGSGPLMNLIGCSSVVAIVVGVRRHRPARPLPWYLFAAGQGLYWAGDLYTYTYPRVFGGEVPFPSIGDGFYVLVYPVLMAGLLSLVRRRNPDGDRAGLLDALIISVGLSLVSWVLLVAPNLHLSDATELQKVVSVAYPLGDVLLLGAGVRLAVDKGLRQGAFFLLFGSIVVLLLTDSTYTYFTLAGSFDFQVVLDLGWIGYLLLWGAAALHPSMTSLDRPAPERSTHLSLPRLGLLATAALIAPVTEILISGRKNIDLFVLFLASIVLFALVIARMADLVGEQERSVERERTLNAGGAALVAAAGVEDMYSAALHAAAELSGLGVLACELSGGAVSVVASRPAGLHPHGPVGPLASGLLATAAGDDGRLWTALGLPGPAGPMLVLPLTVRDDVRAMIVLAGRPIRAVERSLQALASHVSLALEGAALNQEVLERSSQARLSSLVQHSSDLITVLDADATITYQSPSIERVLGYTPAEAVGMRFDHLLAEGESRVLGVLADGPVVSGHPEARPLDARLRTKDGTVKPFEILITDLRGDEHIGGIVLNARDVSERRAMEEALSYQAFHDSVTGLANRTLFTERVNHALTLARREPRTVAVMFLDLDDFKTVNDSLGHAAGDAVLCEVARRLEGAVRVSDTPARFGGDEFAVLLETLETPQSAAETAERVLRAFVAPMNVDGKELCLRASIGIAVVEPGDATLAEELLRNADAAMYIAKRDGKGDYRMFEPAMHEGVLARLELRADLQRALAEGQFVLHYQPVVRLADDTVGGVEALLRWEHPERGLVPPDEFVPFAEETGLIVDIGRWVLQEGCREAKRLAREHPRPLTMAVNLSVKQLQHPDVVAHVREALDGAGLEPGGLTLEITESVMMDDVDLAAERLRELKALGLRLALDDFGTGYSSLSYLGRFPLDVLKMDRSFLREDAPPETAGLANAVIAIGGTLHLDIVAEGVEQPAQYAVLRQLGCDLGQGYLFARPLTGAELDAYLHERNGVAAV